MSKKLRALVITLIAASVLLLPVGNAWGDMGGFSGSSDYSSGYDSGSSYSYDNGSSYSYSHNYNYDDHEWDEGDDFALIEMALVALILLALTVVTQLPSRGKSKGKGKSRQPAPAPVRITDSFDASKLNPISTLKDIDPSFNEKALRKKLGDWYVKMQNAWTAKDMDGLRPIFTDALFSQFDSQLDSLRNRKQTNYVDDIVIEGVELRGWYVENDEQVLAAWIKAAIVDYTVADESGRLVSGSKTDIKHMTYRWILTRSKDATSGGMTEISCPNCGAALMVNQTSKCPYCDSIVTLETHDWVISNITGLEQRTKRRG